MPLLPADSPRLAPRSRARLAWRWLLPLLLAFFAQSSGCSLLADRALSDKPSQGAGGAGQGASGPTGGGACGASCGGKACCGGQCVDLNGDEGHCGACGVACKSGESCCQGACVDVGRDRQNCGECGKACPNTLCLDGQCSSQCVLNYGNCDGNIVVNGCEADLSSDAQHCGGCDIRCPTGKLCNAGNCTCAPDRFDCDAREDTGCEVDGASDPKNCGGCGKACGPNTVCQNGQCACEAGYADCDHQSNNGCEAALGSSDHCSSCTDACATGMVCDPVNGKCKCADGRLDCDPTIAGCESFSSSPTTCGSCTVHCDASAPRCDGTTCVASCPTGSQACGLECVNVLTDPNHCGDCTTQAGLHQHCESGHLACDTGFGDCDGMPGCETDLSTDLHCGTCVNACQQGEVCSNGTCVCGASTPKRCSGVSGCRACCDASDCSDGDSCSTDTCAPDGMSCTHSADCATTGGHCCSQLACYACCSNADCPSGGICSGHTCITCTPPMAACNGQCVDLTSSPENCGACGNSCLSGRTCQSGTCSSGWVTMSTTGAPAPRVLAASTWAGRSLFVWGGHTMAGDVSDGGLYDPAADRWTLIPPTGAPSARVLASAVWTGTRVLVWGGAPSDAPTATTVGGQYDPATPSWTPISSQMNAPSPRRMPIAVWTGDRMLIWGGVTGTPTAGDSTSGTPLADGALYDPSNDTWSTISAMDAAPARSGVAWAWSGTELYLFGGRNATNNALTNSTYVYNPGSDSWRVLTATSAPSARYDAFAVWTNQQLVIWGGRNPMGKSLEDGARYDVATHSWLSLSTTGIPSKRGRAERRTGWTGWTGTQAIVDGGNDGGALKLDGAAYTPGGAWMGFAAASKQHEFGVGVWSGAELVLWSGLDGGALTPVGERFRP